MWVAATLATLQRLVRGTGTPTGRQPLLDDLVGAGVGLIRPAKRPARVLEIRPRDAAGPDADSPKPYFSRGKASHPWIFGRKTYKTV